MGLVHDTRLDPFLKPADYYTDAAWQAERNAVFERHWHPVAPLDFWVRDGDYVATTILDVPVLVWKRDGVLRAFRNVCAHRHAELVDEGRGCAQSIACRYHGWRYDSKGALDHLPDGRCFKGLKAREVALAPVRVETIANVAFVNLASDAPSLRETIGPLASQIDAWFANYEFAWSDIAEGEINWKLFVENALEGYHAPVVHRATFGGALDDAHYHHTLGNGFSRFENASPQGFWSGWTGALASRIADSSLQLKHINLHLFPNHLVDCFGLMRVFYFAQPLGAMRTRVVHYVFAPKALRHGLLAQTASRVYLAHFRSLYQRVIAEDRRLWPALARGIRGSTHRGVLSAREERVWHFQQTLRTLLDAGKTDSP